MKQLKLFFALFAMLALGVGNAWGAALGSGYSKVTDISTLSAGDKVVIYCDDESVGVTGFNTSTKKDATVAATGWVEYLVESATGGVLLKDGDNYISLTTKNTFTYATKGSVCKVNSSGVLCCTLSGTDYFLYKNSTYYRMYVDKSSNSSYKPFYVYKVVAEGENPGEGGGEAPVIPTQLSAPANLTEGTITETSATLSWDAVANASNYSVTIDGKTATANTNSYDATGLIAGTSYTWSVVAKGDGTNYTDSKAAEHTFTTTTATVTPEPGTGSETATATLIFDNTSKRTTSTTIQQIWEENGVVFTYDKANYSNNLADYSNPIRLYQGTTITIACSKGKITQIEFATNASKYVEPMVNSLGTSFGTVVKDGNNVTLTLNTPAEVIGAIALAAQVRLNSITVTYEKVASVEPTITCSNSVNFGVVSANVNTTKELVVEAENLTENITAVLTSGTNFAVSGDLTTAGGTLTLSVTATEEGTYTDKLTLTSGTTIKEVEVSATVVVCQGKGTEENPYTINDVIKLANPSPTITAWVEGYIVGVIINNKLAAPDSETKTNIVLATSATETEKIVPVALPDGDIREALNLVDHSEYLGKKVAVYGTLEKYYEKTGVKNVTNYQWVSTEGDVAAPVIEGDEYFEESTTITITAAEGTTIYYTIGETTPDKNANQYAESFTVNETKTVNAIAYDANGNASEVTTKTFTKLSTLTCEAALSETAIDVNYIVKGYVTEINTAYSSSYNNITFSMADTKGGSPVLKAYRVTPKQSAYSNVQVGDYVKVIGKLTQYSGTNQIAQGGEYEILTESKNPIISGVETFADKTTVTITARDGLTIYYTLDNTDPTNGSNKYEAPFELTETKTVKAITYDGTSYSGIVEKTFTKTEIPTKTVAEFIAAGGTRCYLEGIVSNIVNTTYGNFDLTDATGTIYIYGCLNANGEAKKFAELGVKNGDKIKVIADEYELYDGTKDEAKNVQYVSHISAASITISDITMKVEEVKTISATVEPAEAVVTYTIKENAANAISLSGNTITALAEGTATITATVAEGATYMGNSVDFTVTVTPESASDEVVILAELDGKWYAMKGAVPSGKSNQLDALEVTYFNGTLYNVAEADKASITWTRSVVDGKATFVNNGKYLKGGASTDLTLVGTVDNNCKWMWNDENGYYTTNTSGTIRTFLYRENYNFKNYGVSQAEKNDENGDYSKLPVVTAPVYATAIEINGGDNSTVIAANEGQEVNVIVDRAFEAGEEWYTLCVPFNMPASLIGTAYQLSGLIQKDAEYVEVNLAAKTTIEAGKPYLVKPSVSVSKFVVENVVIVKTTGASISKSIEGLSVTMQGVINGDGTTDGLYWVGNHGYLYNDSASKLGLRTYFKITTPSGIAPRMRVVAGENVETGVEDLFKTDAPVKVIENGQLIIIRDGVKYNVQGQKL